MPFEPRLFGVDSEHLAGPSEPHIESDADLHLPHELAALAGQLRTEADALAVRYPPSAALMSTGAMSVGAPRGDLQADDSVRTWILWSGIAAAVLLVGLLAWRPAGNATNGAAQGTNNPPAVAAAHKPANPDLDAIRQTQGISEVSVETPPAAARHPADEVAMLRAQVNAFGELIRRLEVQLQARDAAQAEAQRQIESLRQEISELQKRLEARSGK